MKKTTVLLLALATAATITSCVKIDVQGDLEQKEPETQEQTQGMMGGMGGMQLPNPIKTYSDAEEISAILGFTVQPLPEAESISFSTISDNIAQTTFTLNGIEYTLRADDENADFSGVYTSVESENTNEVLLPGDISVSVINKKLTDGNSLIFWANPEKSVYYSLYIEGQPENINEIIEDTVINNSPVQLGCKESLQKVDFEWNTIRTDAMYENKTHYPYTVVISSKEELNNYYTENKTSYYLERAEKVYSNTTIGFLDETDKYDEEFFKENSLIFVITENGSGSIRHNVKNVEYSQFKTVITIKNTVPEICTDDMAYWHIFVSVPKSAIIPKNIELIWEK